MLVKLITEPRPRIEPLADPFLVKARSRREGANFINIYEQIFLFKSIFFAELFSTYHSCLNFFGERKLAQKLLVKCWRN